MASRRNQRRKQRRQDNAKPQPIGPPPTNPERGVVVQESTYVVTKQLSDPPRTLTQATLTVTTRLRSDGTFGSTTDPAAFLGRPCPF